MQEYLCIAVCSTELEKKAEHVLSGSKSGGAGEKEGTVSRGEKWPKQCMHI
jgi:hypothetical protein